MTRFKNYGAVIALLFACGCGGGSTSTPDGHSSGDRQELQASPTTVASSEPDLETVPEQTEPMDESMRGAEAFAALVKAADTNDADGWARAERELHALGASATSALAAHLADDNRVARELASMFLAQLGPDAVAAADGLAKLLNDESTFARVNAAAALSTFEGYAEKVTPVLKGLLGDDDVNVRLTAAISLRNVGPSAAIAIRELTQALGDPAGQVRAAAAATLGELGSIAQKSLPALRELAMDQDREVAIAASRAIRRIDETARDATAETIPASATR